LHGNASGSSSSRILLEEKRAKVKKIYVKDERTFSNIFHRYDIDIMKADRRYTDHQQQHKRVYSLDQDYDDVLG
jgi:hypothetical protein